MKKRVLTPVDLKPLKILLQKFEILIRHRPTPWIATRTPNFMGIYYTSLSAIALRWRVSDDHRRSYRRRGRRRRVAGSVHMKPVSTRARLTCGSSCELPDVGPPQPTWRVVPSAAAVYDALSSPSPATSTTHTRRTDQLIDLLIRTPDSIRSFTAYQWYRMRSCKRRNVH